MFAAWKWKLEVGSGPWQTEHEDKRTKLCANVVNIKNIIAFFCFFETFSFIGLWEYIGSTLATQRTNIGIWFGKCIWYICNFYLRRTKKENKTTFISMIHRLSLTKLMQTNHNVSQDKKSHKCSQLSCHDIFFSFPFPTNSISFQNLVNHLNSES